MYFKRAVQYSLIVRISTHLLNSAFECHTYVTYSIRDTQYLLKSSEYLIKQIPQFFSLNNIKIVETFADKQIPK